MVRAVSKVLSAEDFAVSKRFRSPSDRSQLAGPASKPHDLLSDFEHTAVNATLEPLSNLLPSLQNVLSNRAFLN